MDGLEERFLVQNRPGRWSSHTGNTYSEDSRHAAAEERECSSDASPDEGLMPGGAPNKELFDLNRNLMENDVPETVRMAIMNERSGKAQTGVKGVLADYQAHLQMEAAAHEQAELHKQQVIDRIVNGYVVSSNDNGTDAASSSGTREKVGELLSEFADEYNDDYDDEFMRDYRQNRLKELKKESSQQAAAAEVFGFVKEVTAQSFLEEVDTCDRRVVVVVHVYEPGIQSCIRVNRFLDGIAASMSKYKFLKMNALSNGCSLDDKVGYPLINIYKAGELLVAIPAVEEELGLFFEKADVEWLIESKLTEVQ